LLLGKIQKKGRNINDLIVGEKLTITEKIEDKDLLLYLGLTNDNNPLYIQHDFASKTIYKKPIVPPIMLMGIITAAISKYLPGPGAYITKQNISFLSPAYHYSTLKFTFEVMDIDVGSNGVVISVTAKNEQNNAVLAGTFYVNPPAIEQ